MAKLAHTFLFSYLHFTQPSFMFVPWVSCDNSFIQQQFPLKIIFTDILFVDTILDADTEDIIINKIEK